MPRFRHPRMTYTIVLFVLMAYILYLNQNRDTVRTFVQESVLHLLDTVDVQGEDSMIDWVDPKLLEMEKLRTGPGEHGSAVFLNITEKVENAKLLSINGFSALVSDKISLVRSINDLRLDTCKSLKYNSRLPSVSIIITFHEEHLSTLLRTVHTILMRAPAKLVHEVILVDDNSTKPSLGSQLDNYVKKTFDNVRIIRTGKREGLIRARLIGAKAAVAPVLIFIDSHCEAGINWLPPLLQPIYDNDTTVTCPFIDVIRNNDFLIVPQDEGSRGAFDWNFNYQRLPRLPGDEKHPEKPFLNPIMSGGLFAISRRWFWKLGGYDSDLEIWGGEQYELSFKTWMCGGTILDIPCSRIAHVYKSFNPFEDANLVNTIRRNYKRIAEVWMDDWKKYIYLKHPGEYLSLDAGDLTKQRELRAELKCQSFDWFMKYVAFDLEREYPVIEPKSIAIGRFISSSNPNMCIDTKFGWPGDPVRFDKCVSDSNQNSNAEQLFEFTWRRDIRIKGKLACFDYPGDGRRIVLHECHSRRGNQRWKYNPETKQMHHVASGKCIDSNVVHQEIFMESCKNVGTQMWTLEQLDIDTAMKHWNKKE